MIKLTHAILKNYDMARGLGKFEAGDAFYVNPDGIREITTRKALVEAGDGSWEEDEVTEIHTAWDTLEVMEGPLTTVLMIRRWYRGIHCDSEA